jgi:hypothetical protein
MPLPSLLVASLLFPPSFQAGVPAQEVEDALPAADPAITRAELEHHVRFLASDELGGRAPLTPGHDRAARYLARALAEAGLEPAGADGTFFQDTGAARYVYPSAPRLLLTTEQGETVELAHGAEFTLRVRGTARSTEKLPLRVFYDYNHERMPLAGEAGEALFFSAFKQDKKRILTEKGIANLDDWGLEIEVMPGEKGLEKGAPRPELAARVVRGPEPEACELVELRGPVRPDFERRRFTHVQLLVEEERAPFSDRNVVARIRGAGTPERPELAQEVVVLSAHYDHLGERIPPKAPERPDILCNGADDNASGCAALLELAQALAAGPPPVRTLVFLFTTSEESGGAGSARYLADPAEPLARTVANVNLEMIGRPDPLAGGPGKLWLTGHERTNLGAVWEAQGLAIVADPRPQESFFRRSDNYAFALEGIVAQTLSSFALHDEYHTPRDEPDTLDYDHLEAAARVAHAAARTLADGSLAPAWNEGGQPKRLEVPERERRTDEEREAERERRRAEREARAQDEDDEKKDD